jgi:hypothetical protein
LKQALWFFALLGAILSAGCASSDTTSQTTYNTGTGNEPYKPTTHLLHRAIVTNYYSSLLNVVDATENRLTSYTFATGSQPTYMQSSPDGTLTFINDVGASTIASFNNLQETVKGTVALGGYTNSFVTSKTNFFGFAAVPNYNNGTSRLPGAIVRFNPTDGVVNTQIQFPNVEYLGMDPAQEHLIAFTNGANPDDQSPYNVPDIAHWVDLTNNDPSTGVPPYYPLVLTDTSGSPVTLSVPSAVFFSSDGSKAYVLSCGIECGGSDAASVAVIDTTSIKPATPVVTGATGTPINATVTKVWKVNGAQKGMINTTTNTLYVAGSTGTTTVDSGGNKVMDGWFTAIDLADTTSTPATVAIGPGTNRIIRTIGSGFWIGARNCGVSSCVTMVNSALSASTLSTAKGDATGITLCTNSSQVYTIEGGRFYFYNESGKPLTSQYQTQINGYVTDVLYID